MSVYYVAGIPYSDELYHHGIKGQKWGIRRYQNPDGTLTEAGRERYGSSEKGRANAQEIKDGYYRSSQSDNSSYGETESRLRSKHADAPSTIRKAIETSAKSNDYERALDEYNTAVFRRNANLNPFKAKKLYEEMISKRDVATKKLQDVEDMASNITMEYINTLPKEDRDLAKRFTYMVMGWDW